MGMGFRNRRNAQGSRRATRRTQGHGVFNRLEPAPSDASNMLRGHDSSYLVVQVILLADESYARRS